MNISSKATISIADDDLWSSLYNLSINKVPFSSGEWRSSICSVTGLLCDPLILMQDNNLLAGINIYYQKKSFKKFCSHPVLTPYNTILLSGSFAALDPAISESLWQQFLIYIRKNYIYPYFLVDTVINDAIPFRKSGLGVKEGHTYIVDPSIAVPDADIRRRARKCSETGFYIRDEVNVQVFHRLFHTTAVRQGIKNVISEEQLQMLLMNCKDFTWGLTAYDNNDVPHASWIQMTAGNVVYNWNAASNAELLSKGGTPFIVMKLLEKLKEDHIAVWDLCGADNPSVARFKASIGGKLTPYFKINFSEYSIFDKFRFRLLQLR